MKVDYQHCNKTTVETEPNKSKLVNDISFFNVLCLIVILIMFIFIMDLTNRVTHIETVLQQLK